jgi:hypothetical protein
MFHVLLSFALSSIQTHRLVKCCVYFKEKYIIRLIILGDTMLRRKPGSERDKETR